MHAVVHWHSGHASVVDTSGLFHLDAHTAHAHTHSHRVIPFENHKPTGLKLWILSTVVTVTCLSQHVILLQDSLYINYYI